MTTKPDLIKAMSSLAAALREQLTAGDSFVMRSLDDVFDAMPGMIEIRFERMIDGRKYQMVLPISETQLLTIRQDAPALARWFVGRWQHQVAEVLGRANCPYV